MEIFIFMIYRFLIILIFSAFALSAYAECPNLLVIKKSDNNNVLYYDYNYNTESVDVYWNRRGERMELSYLEEMFLGVTEEKLNGDHYITINNSDFSDLKFKIEIGENGCAFAKVQIDSDIITLKDAYAQMKNGKIVPGVEYLDLNGTGNNSRPITKRVIIDG